MKQGAEEQSLPPTAKKLRDARKRGQVARSRDFPSAIGFAAALAALWATWPATTAAIGEALSVAAAGHRRPFAVAAAEVAGAAGRAVLVGAAPVALAGLLAGLLAGIVALRGIPFSFDPVSPKLDHLNPVEGFRRLFQLRNMIEVAKAVAKTLLLGAILLALLLPTLGTLMHMPACGVACGGIVGAVLLTTLLAAAAAVFLVGGLLDLGLQRFLFVRDMRMSHSEAKRERKDADGDPQIRSARRRLAREAAEGATRLGVAQATLVAADGARAIGIRFARGVTPVPVVVVRGEGERAAEIMAEAARERIPVLNEAELCRLLARTPPGAFVPQAAYGPVARALFAVGVR